MGKVHATMSISSTITPDGANDSSSAAPLLEVRDVCKSFHMHLRGDAHLPVMSRVSLTVAPSECLVLAGPSGIGKSTLLRMIFANYRCDSGSIRVRSGNDWIDITQADPRTIHALRRTTLGYVGQFLRVIPRVSTQAIVAGAGRSAGMSEPDSTARAADLLERLNIPSRLWDLPPATFSGGEQQRVNIARGLIGNHAVLLLDEPTASLDPVNRAVVIELILEAKARGAAVLGIFHDTAARDRVADRYLDLSKYTASTPDGDCDVDA
jgi:alpha-D-ribose 1-methylphosphonate 5-triphosphate synthase subunit PhnL